MHTCRKYTKRLNLHICIIVHFKIKATYFPDIFYPVTVSIILKFYYSVLMQSKFITAIEM